MSSSSAGRRASPSPPPTEKSVIKEQWRGDGDGAALRGDVTNGGGNRARDDVGDAPHSPRFFPGKAGRQHRAALLEDAACRAATVVDSVRHDAGSTHPGSVQPGAARSTLAWNPGAAGVDPPHGRSRRQASINGIHGSARYREGEPRSGKEPDAPSRSCSTKAPRSRSGAPSRRPQVAGNGGEAARVAEEENGGRPKDGSGGAGDVASPATWNGREEGSKSQDGGGGRSLPAGPIRRGGDGERKPGGSRAKGAPRPRRSSEKAVGVLARQDDAPVALSSRTSGSATPAPVPGQSAERLFHGSAHVPLKKRARLSRNHRGWVDSRAGAAKDEVGSTGVHAAAGVGMGSREGSSPRDREHRRGSDEAECSSISRRDQVWVDSRTGAVEGEVGSTGVNEAAGVGMRGRGGSSSHDGQQQRHRGNNAGRSSKKRSFQSCAPGEGREQTTTGSGGAEVFGSRRMPSSLDVLSAAAALASERDGSGSGRQNGSDDGWVNIRTDSRHPACDEREAASRDCGGQRIAVTAAGSAGAIRTKRQRKDAVLELLERCSEVGRGGAA